MFYRHWKKIALALAAILWSGCSDNSTSSDGKIAYTYKGSETTNAFQYHCDTEEDYNSPDREKNCTNDVATSYSNYKCDDGAYCDSPAEAYLRNGFKCYHNPDSSIKYTDEEFYQKYYIKD